MKTNIQHLLVTIHTNTEFSVITPGRRIVGFSMVRLQSDSAKTRNFQPTNQNFISNSMKWGLKQIYEMSPSIKLNRLKAGNIDDRSRRVPFRFDYLMSSTTIPGEWNVWLYLFVCVCEVWRETRQARALKHRRGGDEKDRKMRLLRRERDRRAYVYVCVRVYIMCVVVSVRRVRSWEWNLEINWWTNNDEAAHTGLTKFPNITYFFNLRVNFIFSPL